VPLMHFCILSSLRVRRMSDPRESATVVQTISRKLISHFGAGRSCKHLLSQAVSMSPNLSLEFKP